MSFEMYKFVVSQGNNGAIVKEALEARGCWSEATELEAKELRAHLIWKQLVLPIRSLLILESNIDHGFPPAIHNHLDNNREITTKPGLIRSLRGYYQTLDMAIHSNYHAYDSMATSFIITAACEDLEYHSMINRYAELQSGGNTKERMPGKHCRENIWLIKPAALNQGRGIEICHNLKEIKGVLGSKPANSVWVVQKYIERPLLFQGRKFDIRVWALATARKELFFYKHGYLRTSSSEYSTEAKDNYIHLTNNCLQKWGDNYGIHESGNTLSFSSFQAYLSSEFPDLGLSVTEHFVPRMKDLIIDSYLSAKKILHGHKRKNAFELLGYDFLIDEDFRVWLIEVNTNPYLGIPNEYIKELLPVMLDDMLSIAVDPYYPPPSPRIRLENDFELLYCEVSSQWAKDGTGKNIRRPFTASLYPVPALAQVPMYKQNTALHMSPGGKEDDPEGKKPPTIVRDTYSTLKEILDTQLSFDVSDFTVITARILSHLQHWELSAKEQIASALQALKLLCGSPGNLALSLSGHFSSLLALIQSENVPDYIQSGIFEALTTGCAETRFKRELVKSKVLSILIPQILSPKTDPDLQSTQLQLIYIIGRHPAKTYYIPGETRENNLIREMFISQGGLTCLYKLSQEVVDEAVRTEIRHHLSSEFGLADWDEQVKTLSKVLKPTGKDISITPDLPSSVPTVLDLTAKQKSGRKGYSPDLSFGAKQKHVRAQFPAVLMDVEFLARTRREIEEFCEVRRRDMKQKQVEDAKKKEDDYDEKLRLREEEDRAYEDRRQKAEQELLKRYLDRKQKKIEELRKQSHEKALEDRLDEERRQALLEKIRKQEEMRKFERMRKKQEFDDYRRLEDEKHKAMEERRRIALNEWLRMKDELEKDRKLKEKIGRERDEAKRIEELNVKRMELRGKLGDKRGKRQKTEIYKTKDAIAPSSSHQSVIVSSAIENIDTVAHHSSKIDRFLLDPTPARPKLEPYELKAASRSQPPTKKRNVIPDQFLFEVYGNISHAGKKKKSGGKRTMSKIESVPEGAKKAME